jgi:bile acid:Na+ symporter, BASS family
MGVLNMDRSSTRLDSFLHIVHARFVWILVASYAVAAVCPGLGLGIRGVSFGEVSLFQGRMELTLPGVMLGMLLLNAGLGVRISDLGRLARDPSAILLGLSANVIVPVVFIYVLSNALGIWHNPDEVQSILVGLALVTSMPIAGSSTAWSQNANGDLALSLGLVVLSTVTSPISTPLALHSVGLMARGDYATSLHSLAGYDTGEFLIICVVLPSLLGIGLRVVIGKPLAERIRPALKVVNLINLLLLSYSNAAISLPQALKAPDWDFLGAVLIITTSLCLFAFGAGSVIGRELRLDSGARTSLMFGLGMNNNGTGLVLASMTFADRPRVLLPIIFYNLVQQVVAGFIGSRAGSRARKSTLAQTLASVPDSRFAEKISDCL